MYTFDRFRCSGFQLPSARIVVITFLKQPSKSIRVSLPLPLTQFENSLAGLGQHVLPGPTVTADGDQAFPLEDVQLTIDKPGREDKYAVTILAYDVDQLAIRRAALCSRQEKRMD